MTYDDYKRALSEALIAHNARKGESLATYERERIRIEAAYRVTSQAIKAAARSAKYAARRYT